MRKEKRFLILKSDYSQLIDLIKEIGSIDHFCDQNGMYDIDSRYLMVWSKKNMRGKIRLRSYTVAGSKDYYLENKYKHDGMNEKIRIAIQLQQYMDLIQLSVVEEILDYIRGIDDNILFFLEEREPCDIRLESIHLSYTRNAFHVMHDEKKHRITIDFNIRLHFGKTTVPLYDTNSCVVEIKGYQIEEIMSLFRLDEIGIHQKASKYNTAKKFLENIGE